MKAKKLVFNGFIAFGFLGAIVCYFLPFFKLSGMLGLIDDAFFDNAASCSMLDLFLYTLDINNQDEQLIMFAYIVLPANAPTLLAPVMVPLSIPKFLICAPDKSTNKL